MTDVDRVGNVLGALALSVTDRTAAAVTDDTGHSPSAAAALSALHHFLDRPTVDRLRRVLGLTHSGAVRLVDRLDAAGLVVREPGADSRSRAVVLTDRGREAAVRVTAARTAALGAALASFSDAERQTLHTLLGRLMAGVVEAKDGGAWICRLCDVHACGRTEGHCPVANAAAEKYPDAPRFPRPQ
jgi:DNA-binding MarR family transcriptional regulator